MFRVLIQFISTKKKVDSLVNVEIDMNQVADGTYTGSSDVGLVKAEVEVEVKEHKIVNINLLKHQCGKGQHRPGRWRKCHCENH